MALLRLSNGQIYTSYEDINRICAPLRVGAFDVAPEKLRALAGRKDAISQADAVALMDGLSERDVAMVRAEGFRFRRVGHVLPSRTGDGTFQFALRDDTTPADAVPAVMTGKEVADYLIPHYVLINDWHFVFTGAIVKGVRLSEDLQGIVYTQAGEWVRLSPQVLNWPIFPYGEPTLAVSWFDADAPYDQPVPMDLHPEVKVLPTMLY